MYQTKDLWLEIVDHTKNVTLDKTNSFEFKNQNLNTITITKLFQ